MDSKDIRIQDLQERLYKKQQEIKRLEKEVEQYRYRLGLRSDYKPEDKNDSTNTNN